jgi:hypothetical protein
MTENNRPPPNRLKFNFFVKLISQLVFLFPPKFFRECKRERERTYVELTGNGVLLVCRRKNHSACSRLLSQSRERVVRRQPRVPIERQPLHLFKTFTFHHNIAQTKLQKQSKMRNGV